MYEFTLRETKDGTVFAIMDGDGNRLFSRLIDSTLKDDSEYLGALKVVHLKELLAGRATVEKQAEPEAVSIGTATIKEGSATSFDLSALEAQS
jgi:hypothetical protein